MRAPSLRMTSFRGLLWAGMGTWLASVTPPVYDRGGIAWDCRQNLRSESGTLCGLTLLESMEGGLAGAVKTDIVILRRGEPIDA
jgi:hypothetical protein